MPNPDPVSEPTDLPDHVTHVNYWAISLFNSKTFWVNNGVIVVALLIEVLSATDVITVIPKSMLPFSTALVAVLNIYMRTITQRPARVIAPGTTTPVLVPRIDPPQPRAVSLTD